MNRIALFVSAVLALATSLTGCGEDSGATCQPTLCEVGEAAVCSGNDIRRCVDGLHYSYTTCGAQQRCDASSGAATCVPRQCTTLGIATCSSPTTISMCLPDGSGLDTTTCATAERCMDGACVPTVCSEGADVCTTNGFLHCNAGSWGTTACAPGEICSVAGGLGACGPKVCTPGTFRCVGEGKGQTARACDVRGTSETGSTCGSGETCVEGRCQVEVCGVSTPDATSPDTSDGDVAEPEAQITFRIGGQTFVLNQTAFVEFDDGPKTLTMRAAKSTRELRIIFENSRANLTGTFSDDTFSTVKVVVCYNDGGATQTFDRCPDGFTHQSSLYDVVVATNPGPNEAGRATGTFSATVNDENGDPTQILDGTFTLKFR